MNKVTHKLILAIFDGCRSELRERVVGKKGLKLGRFDSKSSSQQFQQSLSPLFVFFKTISAAKMFEKEGFAEMYKIVCSMISRPESSAFREPVDWKAMGLLDYLNIVKSPMDLGTIKTKIEASKYNSLDEIASDVRLVWRNCMLYNRDGSEVNNTF